jgi:hypothetical protein
MPEQAFRRSNTKLPFIVALSGQLISSGGLCSRDDLRPLAPFAVNNDVRFHLDRTFRYSTFKSLYKN